MSNKNSLKSLAARPKSSRRKRRRSKRQTFAIERTFETDGVDFVALLAGLTTSLLLLFLVWSRLQPSERAELVVNAVASPNAGAALPSGDFKQAISEMSVEQCVLWLQKNQIQQDWTPTQTASLLARRREVANELLKRKLNPTQRNLAMLTKFSVMSDLQEVAWRHPEEKIADVISVLANEAKVYPVQPISDVSIAAQLGLITYECYCNEPVAISPGAPQQQDRMNYTVVAKMISELLANVDVPVNQEPTRELTLVVQRIEKLLVSLLDVKHTPIEIANGTSPVANVIGQLHANSERFASPLTGGLIQSLDDRVQLIRSRLSERFERRWVDGPAGRERVIEIAKELLDRPRGGNLVQAAVEKVAFEFEMEKDFEAAKEVYNALAKRSSSSSIERDLSNRLNEATAGLKRIELVGQPFEFTGVDSAGNTLSPTDFQDRAVAIIFWSASDATSVAALRTFYPFASQLGNRRLVILAYCIDQKDSSLYQKTIAKFPAMRFVSNSSTLPGNEKILEQCPGNRTPRFMLIDKRGLVRDANLAGSEFLTQAELLEAE